MIIDNYVFCDLLIYPLYVQSNIILRMLSTVPYSRQVWRENSLFIYLITM